MLKTFLTTILFFLSLAGFSQSDYITLHRAAHKHFDSGNVKQSILYFDSAYHATRPTIFNNSYSVVIDLALEGDSTALELVKAYAASDLRTAAMSKPIWMYLQIKSITDNTLLKKEGDKLLASLKSSKDTSYYSGLFYTGAFLHLKSHLNYSAPEIKNWVKSLEKQNNLTSAHRFEEVNALMKYLEFVLKNELFESGNAPAEDVLAVHLSPEMVDDLSNFSLAEEKYGFVSLFKTKKSLIEKMLEETDRREQALLYAVQLVTEFPSLENQEWLKQHYDLEMPFEKFWLTHSHKNMQIFQPNGKIRAYLDSLNQGNEWTVLDVWGTWCSPCVAEMPKFQAMHEAFKKFDIKPVRFASLSYSSKNLPEFMETNKYDFPVLELEEEDIRFMKIKSYPTTYLISPEGKYVVLPAFTDKEEITKVYSLVEW